MTTSLDFVATCDLAAQVRGRAVPATARAATEASGVGWVPADLALHCFDGIADGNRFGSTGDLRLLPDPASAIDLPGDGDVPASRLYLADQVRIDGSAWGGCPRTFLRTALDELREAHGLVLDVAFEHEFMLTDMAPTPPFSWARARAAEPFGSDLVGLLETIGYEPETWLPEYGAGQFEITLAPRPALDAADRAVVLRELVRDLAARRGHHATFAPLVDPAGSGNGVHIHLSLRTLDCDPVMYDAAGPGRLSMTARRFAAGVLSRAGALCAITAPSRVSYLRLTPHRWSAGGAFLAEHNREAMLRICPTPSLAGGDPRRSLHLEYRAADATANPWLALGVLVRAGIAGLEADDAAEVWPESATEDELDGVPLLPSDLGSALAALEADPVARGWFPDELWETYLLVRRSELAELAALDDTDACRRLSRIY